MNEHSIPTQPVSRVISERGVLLPLMAFIILGIFAIIIILGVDSYVVKYAAMSLRGQANDICGHLAKGIVSARKDTAKTFVAQVNAIAASMPSLTTLYSAHLISPTMPEEQIFPADLNGFTGGSGSIVNEHASNPPFLSGSGGLDLCGSGALLEGEPECVEFCASTGKCIYEGDILPTNVESPAPFPRATYFADKYPITMWNNLTNAGNTVGCELRAKVKTFWNVGGFAAERVISARTVVWTPPMGVGTLPADTTTLTSPLSGTPQIPYPGLSIAVGTEMTTSAALNRFRFPSGGFPGYDPTGLNNKFLQFSYDHAGPGSAGSMQSNTISDSIDRLEMAVACVNPATLARNSYLSAIVELASRNSHFRNYTELLHMNPQYRSVLTACSTPTGLNFPTLVAAAGSDIAQVTYQTPFVFYNGGVIQDPYTPPGLGIPPHFGVMTGEGTTLVNGFLNPFPAVAGAAPYGKPDGSGGYNGLTSQTIQYHALLASQLRYCNHLYDKDPLSSSTGGISRFDGLNLPLFYDSRFDPRALEFYYGVDLSGSSSNPIRTPEYLPGGCSSSNCPPWGQSCPWSNGTNYPFSYPTTGCALEGNVRSLKLSELVATLGTTQSCPYPIPHGLTYDSGIPSAWQTECFKPLMRGWPITGEFDTPPSCLSGTSQTQIGPNELRADIVATLAYLGGKTVDHLPGIGSGTAQALVPPGLFKISSADPSTPSWTGLQNAARVFDADRYVSERVSSTTIMLVLHQRLNTAATDSLGTVTAAGSGSSCDRPCSCGSGGSSGDNSEYCKIRCLVVGEGSNLSTVLYHSDPDTGVMRRRPIVIAYFPTNILDASAEAITNLQCAFNASRANTDLDVNFLHVFSPTTDLVFQAQAGNSNCATGSIESLTATQQDQCFQSYWTFILSPPAGAEDSSIVEEAKKDYRDRLVSPSILF